ncbi:hypothetical protein, partial [Pantoea agglomerans]|uniref:hypothetical protein n=1 Tax=Enterobacter agglomerans TaxID=549 RepID=UPI003C7A0949
LLDMSDEAFDEYIALTIFTFKNDMNFLGGSDYNASLFLRFYKVIVELFGNKDQELGVNPIEAFFCSALFSVARDLIPIKSGSNPTWLY